MIKDKQLKEKIGIETKQDILENPHKAVYLGIGSNLGNRISNIEKAKYYLMQNNIKIISASRYYETPSWPNPKNPKFINIVLKAKCYYKPFDLFNICKFIEKKLGRKRTVKNSPRECDIDIIDFKGQVLKKELFLPHKLMHKRSFVLFPLFEIEREWVHPIQNVNIKKLILSLPNNDIRSIKQI